MTILDEIIDASTDSSVAVSDLLRKVQIAAHRLHANDLTFWAKQELSGYGGGLDVPAYRVIPAPVEGIFAGPMQSFRPVMLTVPLPSIEAWWEAELRQPIVELQALANGLGDRDPVREWPAYIVDEYEKSGILRLEYHRLYSARNVISRQSLHGVLDVIRSKALEFALDLQSADPDAGSFGGPTLSTEPQLASVVYNVTNNIYGDGANVASGSHINQRSRVIKGDAAALKRAVESLGLSPRDADQVVAALKDEKSVDKPKFKQLLHKVRTGSIVLAGGLATDVAAGALIELGKEFLGL
ncbi:hypothetical protein [Agromyces allii]|uniref:AbiTii domain-containing protein n=1 Tax=Agromyces allii TaxID=393607 RepID=A0ABP5BE78_9MICO|nr:hypothetical protein [Agromyces allii]